MRSPIKLLPSRSNLAGHLPALLLLLPPSPCTAAAGFEGADATCSAAGAGCGPAGVYPWPMQKGNVNRTGHAPWRVPTDLAKGPWWAWSDPHNDVVRATPLFDDELNIYLSTLGGRIYKFSPDGNMLWRRVVNFTTPFVGSIHKGSFFISSLRGQVLALDMQTGHEVWLASISPVGRTHNDAAAILVEGGLVISSTHCRTSGDGGNTDVVAIRAEDGAFVWRYRPDAAVYNLQASSPGDRTIVFQDVAGGLYRLRLHDGLVIWKSGKRSKDSMQSFTTGAAVCHGGRVYAVSNVGWNVMEAEGTGLLHVYALEDGHFLWERRLPYPANQAVAIGPSVTGEGKFSAVIGIGANPGWPMRLQADFLGPLIAEYLNRLSLAAPWLFASPKATAMLAFDAETGEQQWRWELPPYGKPAAAGDAERISWRLAEKSLGINPHNDIICAPDSCAQPVMGNDGTTFQGWQDGSLYAVRDANGDGRIDPLTEVSTYRFGDGFQGSLGLAPGMLAVAPCGGGLYVFKE